MVSTFTYVPTLKYPPNDTDKFEGLKTALNGGVQVMVFDNSARLDLYLAEYYAQVNLGNAVRSLYEKTLEYSDGYAMTIKNSWAHNSNNMSGGGLCVKKAENGASCFYNVYSSATQTYNWSYSYFIETEDAENDLELRLVDEEDGLLIKEDQIGFGGSWSCNTIFTATATSECKRMLPIEQETADEIINKDFRFEGGDSVTMMQYAFDNTSTTNA